MGRVSYDLAAHRTTTTGTGALTLGAASQGWLTLTAVGAVAGTEVSYTIRTGAAGSYKYEQAWGFLGSGLTTVTRNTIRSTDGVGVALNLSGTSDIFFGPQLTDLLQQTEIDTRIRAIVNTMFAQSGGSYDAVNQTLIFPGAALLAPSSDSRLALRWDPDLTINSTNYPGRYGVQARDFPGPAFNTLSTPLLHSDSSIWLGQEASAAHGGKTALTMRLRQGQTGHWATQSPATLRAEVVGPPDDSSGPISAAFDERGLTYWMAFDFAADADIVTNDGVHASGARNVIALCGLHQQNWAATWAASSGQDSMRMWLKGRTLVWGHAAPGTGNWMRCDVRDIPLNTVFRTEEAAGSDYGLPREWELMDLNAGERVRVIAKVKLGANNTYTPRTEIWTQQGAGALIKRVDYSGPNTFSEGVRYLKYGLYSWEPTSGWWGSTNTRTIRVRTMLTMRADAGSPTITEQNLLTFLNR